MLISSNDDYESRWNLVKDISVSRVGVTYLADLNSTGRCNLPAKFTGQKWPLGLGKYIKS